MLHNSAVTLSSEMFYLGRTTTTMTRSEILFVFLFWSCPFVLYGAPTPRPKGVCLCANHLQLMLSLHEINQLQAVCADSACPPGGGHLKEEELDKEFVKYVRELSNDKYGSLVETSKRTEDGVQTSGQRSFGTTPADGSSDSQLITDYVTAGESLTSTKVSRDDARSTVMDLPTGNDAAVTLTTDSTAAGLFSVNRNSDSDVLSRDEQTTTKVTTNTVRTGVSAISPGEAVHQSSPGASTVGTEVPRSTGSTAGQPGTATKGSTDALEVSNVITNAPTIVREDPQITTNKTPNWEYDPKITTNASSNWEDDRQTTPTTSDSSSNWTEDNTTAPNTSTNWTEDSITAPNTSTNWTEDSITAPNTSTNWTEDSITTPNTSTNWTEDSITTPNTSTNWTEDNITTPNTSTNWTEDSITTPNTSTNWTDSPQTTLNSPVNWPDASQITTSLTPDMIEEIISTIPAVHLERHSHDRSRDLQQRSLCPWRYVANVDPDRYPQTLMEAECLSEDCRCGLGRSSGVGCERIYRAVAVLRRVKPENCDKKDSFAFERREERLAVACTCSLAPTTK